MTGAHFSLRFAPWLLRQRCIPGKGVLVTGQHAALRGEVLVRLEPAEKTLVRLGAPASLPLVAAAATRLPRPPSAPLVDISDMTIVLELPDAWRQGGYAVSDSGN